VKKQRTKKYFSLRVKYCNSCSKIHSTAQRRAGITKGEIMETEFKVPAILQVLYVIAVAVVLLDMFVWRIGVAA
jgi:hypothetical protein